MSDQTLVKLSDKQHKSVIGKALGKVSINYSSDGVRVNKESNASKKEVKKAIVRVSRVAENGKFIIRKK